MRLEAQVSLGTSANLGINLNSQEGADINPSVNLKGPKKGYDRDYLK